MKTVIIVNGIPASGKSTTAKLICKHFHYPYLSIDTIKEPFMDIYDHIDRDLNRELGKAAYKVIWDTVSDAPKDCIYVIDAWFGFQPKSLLLKYLKQSNIANIVEIWNEVSPELVGKRYTERLPFRKKGHPREEYIPELKKLAEQAEPMAIGELLRVNQDIGFDAEALIEELSSVLNNQLNFQKLSNY